MNIISVFDHSLKVELVLHELEKASYSQGRYICIIS